MRGSSDIVRLSKNPADDGRLLHAKITARTAINGVVRYRYTIQLGYWDTTSTPLTTGGLWVPKPSTRTYSAFNSAEDMNTALTTTISIGTGNTVVTRTTGVINGTTCIFLGLPVGGYVVVTFRGKDSNGLRYYTIINFSNSSQ